MKPSCLFLNVISPLIALLIAIPAIAAPNPAPAAAAAQSRFFSTVLPEEPTRPRSTILAPALSLFLPGLDQWYEGQYRSAMAFTGTAAVGLYLVADAQENLLSKGGLAQSDLTSRNNDIRQLTLGTQMVGAMGSFSAYTAFRSAVRTRQPYGEFGFLPPEENVGDLLTAPFEFSFLKRPTTYLPLLLVTGWVAASFNERSLDPFKRNSFNGADFAYGSAFSYLAGTHEEALFRGWMMPIYMEAWGSPFWSNTMTSILFALAHVGPDNPYPLPQLTLGWYLGYLTQKNGWSLNEAIFVHTWWDVIAFTAVYLDESRDRRPEAWIRLPLFKTQF